MAQQKSAAGDSSAAKGRRGQGRPRAKLSEQPTKAKATPKESPPKRTNSAVLTHAARDYAEAIIETVREPLIVLDEWLRVQTANRAFYEEFKVTPKDTQNRLIYELGNRQWDIPALRTLLEKLLPENHQLQDFEVDHEFENIGRRTMLLNARRLAQSGSSEQSILIAFEDITDRKKAEVALRHTMEFDEAVMTNMGEGLYTVDAEGLVTSMNPAAEKLFGWSFEELRGKKMHDMTHHHRPDGTPFPAEECAGFQVLKKGQILVDHQDCFIRKDGIFFDVVYSSAPLKSGYDIIGLVVVFHDITERKRSEKALRDSEAQLAVELAGAQRLQETSTQLIQGGDIEALYQQIVDTAIALMHSDMGSLQMFYRDRDELRLLAWKGVDSESAGFKEWVRPASGSTCGVALNTEHRVIVPDVETFDFMADTEDLNAYRKSGIRALQSTPLVSRPGKIVGMISTYWRRPYQPRGRELRLLDVLARQAADLIERTETEQARARLASIVESSDDAIISKDLNGIITSWNKGAERLFGYTAQETIGQSVTMLIPPDRCDEEPGILKRIRRGEFIDHYETVRRRKDGTLFDTSVTVSPIRNDQGQVVGASKIARDITERKQGELERAGLLKSEHEARRQAENANRLKDEFLAVVSHELRTPLNAILGWAHMLMRGSLDEATANRGLETIARNAKAQNQLISDLLDVSRIISGQLRCEMAAVELIPLIDAAVDTVRPAADAKGIQLSLKLEPDAGMVSGDAARLEQIVSNLLTNAVKFTPRGGRVNVHLKREDTSVVIIVTDTGEGISPEFLPYIFDRFRQAEGKSSRQHGGLGLGLAIVRHLVELHGGTVSAASEGVGKGAEFRAAFPLVAASGNESEFARVLGGRDSLNERYPFLLEGVHVLVVDDELDARELLTIALTQSSAEVRAVGTAREALAVLDQWKADVLISDIGMPGEDGYELIRKVRARARERSGMIPAVAVTGFASDEDAARARIAGFQLHLPKPVSPNNLVAAVASLTLKSSRRLS